MIKFIDWWFAETCKIPNGVIVFLVYVILIRTLLIYGFNMDNFSYMMMDGIIFSIMMSLTLAGPEIKDELKRSKKE
jgi:uncharacterized membrane-anchored protein YitT (DUF2179 family)